MAETVIKKTTITGSGKTELSQTTAYLIYFLFGVIDILLIFRLVFKLSGANPGSAFVNLIYTITQMFIMPFSGIFRQATTAGVETTAVLEPATIVAIVVYAVLGWGVSQLVAILSGKTK